MDIGGDKKEFSRTLSGVAFTSDILSSDAECSLRHKRREYDTSAQAGQT